METKRIAIFASGSGSNAVKLLDYFEKSKEIEVVLLITNNKNAGVLEKTKNRVEQIIINNEEAKNGTFLSEIMHKFHVDYIVLAGYLIKIPIDLIQIYPEHIINIHPALLPKYGGKGMYGMNVHRAVAANKETESGISIHIVNEAFDEGKIIAQYMTSISPEDDAQTIQQKVLKIEHKYYSKTVEDYIFSHSHSASLRHSN